MERRRLRNFLVKNPVPVLVSAATLCASARASGRAMIAIDSAHGADGSAHGQIASSPCMFTIMTIYDFGAKTIDGEEISLAKYRGTAVLIVNVASQCGFTPQYEGLEKLHEKYRGRGFEVLGFPCNQFGAQEPGAEAEIKSFCEAKFGVKFPLFAKIDVNGPQAHPLYKFLREARPGILGTEAIKWNFTKFLVDREGHPIKRYAPKDKPEDIDQDIQRLIAGAPPQ
jgi:glutathione peroxidase